MEKFQRTRLWKTLTHVDTLRSGQSPSLKGKSTIFMGHFRPCSMSQSVELPDDQAFRIGEGVYFIQTIARYLPYASICKNCVASTLEFLATAPPPLGLCANQLEHSWNGYQGDFKHWECLPTCIKYVFSSQVQFWPGGSQNRYNSFKRLIHELRFAESDFHFAEYFFQTPGISVL